jgi:cytochrome c oxidase accessory protein FixG
MTASSNQHPDETLSTLRRDGKRRWLYPVLTDGRYWRARAVVAWSLIILFTGLPIVEIGGKPGILLDIVNRKFILFGQVFYATDTVFLMLFGLASLIGIALITAVAGRVWCGWGCPQTVYLEFVFRPIERFFEGKAMTRKRRDEKGFHWDYLWRKVVKHASYLAISLFLAHTFVAYFVGWESLLAWMTEDPGEHWGFFVMMSFTTGLIMFDFSYFREQMCTTVCPYAKLQSVMLDEDSMIVSYDENRGEPRGRRSRDQRKKENRGVDIELGDCIDCGACVRTCPTGIDIRDGLQLECINCTQCMDACDDIMEKIGKPKGLIRYTSQRALQEDETKIWRPRLFLYGILLAALVFTFGFMLYQQTPVEVELRRSPGSTFQVLEKKGEVANRVEFRISNRTSQTKQIRISLKRPETGRIRLVGPDQIEVKGGQMKRPESWVFIPRSTFDGGRVEAVFDVLVGEKRRKRKIHLSGPIN